MAVVTGRVKSVTVVYEDGTVEVFKDINGYMSKTSNHRPRVVNGRSVAYQDEDAFWDYEIRWHEDQTSPVGSNDGGTSQ